MVALKQGSVPDVIANKLDHLLILTSGTEQYLITCTNKKYKFLLTTTLTISATQEAQMQVEQPQAAHLQPELQKQVIQPMQQPGYLPWQHLRLQELLL